MGNSIGAENFSTHIIRKNLTLPQWLFRRSGAILYFWRSSSHREIRGYVWDIWRIYNEDRGCTSAIRRNGIKEV